LKVSVSTPASWWARMSVVVGSLMVGNSSVQQLIGH